MIKISAAVLTGALLLGGGWVLAQQMVSPDQVAARAEPPAPAPVLAQLREGYLHGAMTMSARAASSGVQEVTAPKTLEGVVTASDLAPGAAVDAGTTVARVNGRPVIVLCGRFALYRDLVQGDSGDDVLMLQHGLADAGFLRGTPDGVFGPRTAAAVRALYQRAGFPAPTTPVSPPPETAAPVMPSEGGAPQVAPAPSRPQTMVRAGELVFTGILPARVTSVAQVGDGIEAGTVLIALANGDTELSSDLPVESIGPLAVGAIGAFAGDDGGSATAAVASIDPGTDGLVRVRWSVEGAVEVDKDYVLTVENPAARAEPALLAPVAAIVSRGGVDTITVADGDVFREIVVEVTGTEGAVAAIRAVGADDSLHAGVEVRLA